MTIENVKKLGYAEWEELEVLDVLDAHDYEALITTQVGDTVYEAIGTYSCNELVEIHEVEVVHNGGEWDWKGKRHE